MSDIIKTFLFEDTSIRTAVRDGETWFCNVDVCAAIGVSNPSQALTRLDEDEKDLISNEGQYYGIINESGLYSLVLGSRKPEAKRFKKWVTSDVLPSIRKTGIYSAKPQLPDFSDPVAAARAWADAEEGKRAAMDQLEAAKPAIQFVDSYVNATGLKGFREVCKLLGVKEPAFRDFLSRKKIMYRIGNSKQWTAYQNHVDAGRFDTKTGEKNGHAYNECKFTPKGVAWVSEQWEKEQD